MDAGAIKEIAKMQEQICEYQRLITDIYYLTKDPNRLILDDNDGIVPFIIRNIVELHNKANNG